MRKCFVTGASGFIGNQLCKDLLKSNYSVTGLIRESNSLEKFDVIESCIENDDVINETLLSDYDYVVHIAGIAHRDINDFSIYQKINTEASIKLAIASAKAGVKTFVYMSSVNAVSSPLENCVDESWNVKSIDAYGISKRKAEIGILEVGRQYGMSVVVLRPTLVYGIGVKGNLAKLIKSIKSRKYPPLPEFNNRRSMVSVGDLISAIKLVLDNSNVSNDIYILSDGVDYSSRRLYEAICRELNIAIPGWVFPGYLFRLICMLGDLVEKITSIKSPVNSKTYNRLSTSACYKSDKISKELGWKPTSDFYTDLPDIIKSLDA